MILHSILTALGVLRPRTVASVVLCLSVLTDDIAGASGRGRVAEPPAFSARSTDDWGLAESTPATQPRWTDVKTVEVAGNKVTLSNPRLVARRKGYLWFPTLYRLSDGAWLASMSDYADEHANDSTGWLAWSEDGGYSWSEPQHAKYGECPVTLANGDAVLLPYYLRHDSDDQISRAYQLVSRGKRQAKLIESGVKVTGWPRKPGELKDHGGKAEWNLSAFVFNGQSVRLADGKTTLATLYGHFAGTKRYSLVAAETTDGVAWRIRSIVADENCPLEGAEGPCEAAICRLKDGRLMCVFRLASNLPYGQCFSSDDGRTWTEPVAMQGPFSVQPSLAVRADGSVALSGGRPGLFLWINRDGSGLTWERIDLMAHHNACVPAEPIKAAGNTTAYTEVAVLDDTHLLMIYDCVPNGWAALPADSSETNSVWVVRVTLEAIPER